MPNSIDKLSNKARASLAFTLSGSVELSLIDFILDVMIFAVVLAII